MRAVVRKEHLQNSADFSGTRYEGVSYVYVWVDEYGEPFYVGSGRGSRAFTISGHRHNQEFMNRASASCVVYIIAENLGRVHALDVERQTVIYMIKNRPKLAQKAYTNICNKYGSTIPVKYIVEKCNSAWESVYRLNPAM